MIPRRSGRRRAVGLIAGVGAMVAGLVAACGSTTFSAEELVAEVNRHGGEIDLGETLSVGDDGPEIHSLTFTGAAPTPEDTHAGGALLIASDDDEALDEYRRCEAAASLICFRAANAVLMFEGAVQEADLARLENAIRAMGEEQ